MGYRTFIEAPAQAGSLVHRARLCPLGRRGQDSRQEALIADEGSYERRAHAHSPFAQSFFPQRVFRHSLRLGVQYALSAERLSTPRVGSS